ncbi:hypothetical protein Focb16_v015430 [Fusarium oxysporum f. sp. cubense]|uniref:Uncharacterized protein n=1 Tax=Fusarium oxysporum f. sp. cubense TaxID=61366 RepID=A0A559KXS4_FUSOC|nr:hypothetical protein Focb16_v015430 [Fusarium oxysporum f. sp. cubense]
MPRKRRPRKAKAVEPLQPLLAPPPTVNALSLQKSDEIHYLQHFIYFTTKQLALSPTSNNFWLRYALPLAHVSEPIKYSMIAVGVAHRLFMARSVGYSQPWELKRLAIYQYNKAISAILPIMATQPSSSTLHTAMVCCLLFIAFEGLTGRYNELLQHLRAGNRLFHDASHCKSSSEEHTMIEKLTEIFCRLGVESSSFMDQQSLSGISQWCFENTMADSISHPSFENLDQVSYELRQLDLRYQDKPWETEPSTDDLQSPGVKDAFFQWSLRFDAFVRDKGDNLPSEATAQLQNLRLRQQWWNLMFDTFSSSEALSNPRTFTLFLYAADTAAAPFIAADQPTFSLDGDLVSGLSFIASVAQVDSVKARALSLLRSLNRREGIWDTRDVVEMHELMVASSKPERQSREYDLRREADERVGIPGIIHKLRLMS